MSRKIIFTLKEKLESEGKTAYWLSKQTNITATSIGKMVNNKNESVRFENLEKICEALNCELEEILQLEKVEK